MKLREIVVESKSKGTYIGVRYSKSSENIIKDFIKENNIPSPDSIKDNGGIHTTLIYSRKVLDDFKPKKNYNGTSVKIKGYKKLGENKNCLVMELTAPELVKRHKQIRKEHGATHDWNEYIPHITLSTEAQDFDETKLPLLKKQLKIQGEYSMPLDDD